MIAGSLNPIMLGQIASGGGGGLLLDTYTNAVLAVSFRKLRSGYTGNCIQVRRSSDSATQNIGFVGNVLDTASLLSFVGAGDAFITFWYDQSTSGNNLYSTEVAPVLQSRIVIGGVLQIANSVPTTIMDGNDDAFRVTTPILASSYSAFVVNDVSGTTASEQSGIFAKGARSDSVMLRTIAQGGGNARASIVRSQIVQYIETPNFTAGFKALTFITAPAKNKINVNNVNLASNTTATTYGFAVDVIGNLDIVANAACYNAFSEFILFTSDEDANASAITSNQMSYYGI